MAHHERRGNSGESASPFSIDKARITLKDAIYLGCFLATAAVSWGVATQGDASRDRELAALRLRVDKQDEALSSLVREVTKVSRDTEWIRDYLRDNKKPHD